MMAGEPPPPPAPLRERVEDWIEEWEQNATDAASAPSVQEMERLERLLRLRSDLAPQPPRSGPIKVAAGVLLLMFVLLPLALTVRMPSTEIHLVVEAEQASLRLLLATPLLPELDLGGLQVSEAASAEVPRPAALSSRHRDVSLRMTARAGDPVGRLRLWEVLIPAGRVVSLDRRSAERPGVGVRFGHAEGQPDQVVEVHLTGAVRVQVTPGQDEVVSYGTPHVATLHVPPGEGLLLEPPAPGGAAGPGDAEPPLLLGEQVPVDSLAFFRLDRSRSAEGRLVRRVSTIRGGTLRYEELDGWERELLAGDGLRFASLDGTVRRVLATPDHIVVEYRGLARGMASGWGGEGRSIMPTVFDWLRARHSLQLAWGALAWALTLALAVHRWVRSPG